MKDIRLFEAVGELDDDLLADAEKFLENTTTTRKKPRPWVRWGGLAACLAVAVCAFWAVFPRGEPGGPQQEVTPPANLQQNAVPPLEITQSTPNVDRPAIESEQPARPVVQVNLNQVTGAPEVETYGVCLWFEEEDFVPMTREELLDYYGASMQVEEILPDLVAVGPKEDSGYGRGIYRSEGRGVYYDTNTFSFESDDGVRGVYVRMERQRQYSYMLNLVEDALAFTTINGWELPLFQYSDGAENNFQYVEFSQNGATYHVRGKNLDNQEFAAVLGTLLEERSDYTPGEPRTFVGEYTGGIGRLVHTSTNPDGSVAVVETWWDGILGLRLEEGAEYTDLHIDLTREQAEEFSDLSLGDRVAVTFTGEPATIGTVWPQQLISLEKIEE